MLTKNTLIWVKAKEHSAAVAHKHTHALIKERGRTGQVAPTRVQFDFTCEQQRILKNFQSTTHCAQQCYKYRLVVELSVT